MADNQPQCRTCKYFQPAMEIGHQGECRKNPPKGQPIPSGPGQISVMGFFPPVGPTAWCGEHKLEIALN